MKVLLFEDNVPEKAGSGGHVITHALIDFLRQRSDLHIVNVVSNPNLKPLTGQNITVVHRQEGGGIMGRLRSLTSPLPKMVAEIDWNVLLAQIEPHFKADRIVLGSARFLFLADRLKSQTYYIADNVEWELALAMESNYRSPALARLDAGRIKMLEARGVALVTRACAFTQRDADALGALAGKKVAVVPPVLPPVEGKKTREPFAFYPTNLDHPPNVDALNWLLNEVWPHQKTNWNLKVTGSGDFASYAEKHPDIDFRGFVSREELADLYHRAGVVLNPTRTGSGFQIKLLEALAYGCPVISTDFSNPLGSAIKSSDDPAVFAKLVDGTLQESNPNGFDYQSLYEDATNRLEEFLDLKSQGS